MSANDIPPRVLAELRDLHHLSRQANGMTPINDPRRLAGDEFCKRALEVRDDYGVSLQDISAAIGLSRAAVYLKIKRRGLLGALLPSQTNYKNRTLDIEERNAKLRSKNKDVCKSGHALTEDNLIHYPSGRRCRKCEDLRIQRRTLKRRQERGRTQAS